MKFSFFFSSESIRLHKFSILITSLFIASRLSWACWAGATDEGGMVLEEKSENRLSRARIFCSRLDNMLMKEIGSS